MTQRLSILIIVVLVTSIGTKSAGGVLDFHGQISSWFTLADVDSLQAEFGTRYIPSFVADIPVARIHLIDAEASFDINGKLSQIRSFEGYESDYAVDPYRLWLRLSGRQYEIRGGLQKINFGSATVFRPLMWFDQIDVRDPLRITDGVYAMLFRYYFLNNTNVWLWSLYGNHEVKGWESFPTDSTDVEYGGRVQVPIFSGEYGVTYHHRDVLLQGLSLEVIPENRIGMDGKWDIGMGVWLEGAIVHMDMSTVPEIVFQQYPLLLLEYKRYFSAGFDYTLNIGNGIYTLAEHFWTDLSDEALGSSQERRQVSALSLRYSLGTLDEVSGVIYYDWDNEELYRYAKWTRTYDRFMINVIGFWNPDVALYGGGNPSRSLLGRGLQMIIAFDH